MAELIFRNFSIKGISACVPKRVVHNEDYKWISKEELKNLIKTTGIKQRRKAEKGVTTSDLCFFAAEKLISEMQWKKNEIDAIVFVTQSADYLLPASAAIIQDRLGLPKNCLAFDINLGCSGYVYGLSVMGGLISGGIKRGLLLTGDISTFNASYKDKSTYPIFGDAGTATAIESDTETVSFFNLHTDGKAHKAIYIPDGGARNFISKKSFEVKQYSKGISRSRIQLVLDGIEILNFSLREVVPNINATFKSAGISAETIDYFIMHQANLLINESIRKILRQPAEKFPVSMDRYGNTSSASIPLTIVSELCEQVKKQRLRMLFSGFGVGLSWGSVFLETSNIVCPEIIEI